jgi:hypothetical protein
MAGEKWWGPEAQAPGAKVSLVLQPPLLDGREGELKNCPTSTITVSIGGGAELSGLEPPRLDSTGGDVTGADTPQHRIENKHRRTAQLARQPLKTKWTAYKGKYDLPEPLPPLAEHCGGMCPTGLALHHPAAPLLKEWATYGCPTRTGCPWLKDNMQEAIDRGPHQSALAEEAIAHFKAEVDKKLKWDRQKSSRGTPSRMTHRRI